MLETIHISNYALIDTLDIDFRQGLNIITGETGAGKSIILGAIGLLLGGRADQKAIRRSDCKSVIECSFGVSDNDQLRQFFEEADIEWAEGQCILRREISPSGRSRSFINDSPVTLTQMHDAGLRLIDIHSQHQNQLLAQPEFQLHIIDSLADNADVLEEYRGLYTRLRESLRRLKATKAAINRDRENADFMEFQLGQLDELDIQPGELEQLEADRETMADSAGLKLHISRALDALTDGQSNASSLLQNVSDHCEELESVLPENENIPERLRSVMVEIEDIADTLRRADSLTNADPAELEYIENRIDSIRTMMRKHNAETSDELITLQEDLRKRLARIADSPALLAELEKEARRHHRAAMETARRISEARKNAAQTFAEILQATAMPLGMRNLRCEIAVTNADMGPTGIDKVEFLFAFNKNQQPIPVSGAASGGEISRLMLCVKAIIASRIQLPAIIFDEIDTGVSGEVASRMGHLMRQLADSIQVIAITHLPQVAAKGTSHYKVYKTDDENATYTRITRLDEEQRVDELALMLSGDPVTDTARANARDLLKASERTH